MAITLRSEKGLPLTYTELDQNFSDLDTRVTAIEGGTALSVNGLTGNVVLTTAQITESNNLYYTDARVDARLANLTTSILDEGTNLYFTNARARSALAAGTGINLASETGTISLNANTSIVSEGTNLYFTNARVDSRLAATSVNALNDVSWTGVPTTNHVLTWDGTSWVPAAAPGATGGEANDGLNLGTGQGLYQGKAGTSLRFFTLAGDGITVSSPVSNVITLSVNSSITTNTIATASNANLNLTPNGSGIVIASNLAISNLSSGRIVYATTNSQLTDSSSLTFNGTAISAPVLTSTVANGTAPLVVASTTEVANLTAANATYATSAGTATSATSATTAGTVTTAAQPNITSVGNLTIANVDNIQLNGNTISSIDTNGNLNITANGTGEVVLSSLAVSDLTSGRVPYVNTNSTIVDSANLTFSGTALTVTGNANVTGVAFVGNLRLQNNHIEANDTNGNLILTPNGTGRLGIGTATPATFVDVNGTVTSTGLTVNGSTTLGESSASTITLTGRFGSSLVPSVTATYDLGSNTNRFRTAFLSGNLDLSGQFVSTIATGTAPFTVTSTTPVANLSVATAGTVITAAQPNITSVGTLTSLGVNGVITGTRLVSNIATGTAPFTVTSTTQVANLSVATAGTAGTVTTAAQPNITSVGNLATVNVGTITSAAANGNVAISPNGSGVTTASKVVLAAGTATASTAPLKFTTGTNLTAAEAGAVEYDGTTLTFTPSTNYGRASIPTTVYTSGVGTSLTPTATGEATAQALFPASGDTITLPVGTYHITLVATITRGATSTTSATARINLGGGGTATGTFSGTAISSIAAGGATSQFMFNGVALTVDNVVSAANSTAAGVYNIYLTGVLRITIAGTFIPKYSMSAALTGATTATAPSALDYLMIQSIATSGSAAATGGWA